MNYLGLTSLTQPLLVSIVAFVNDVSGDADADGNDDNGNGDGNGDNGNGDGRRKRKCRKNQNRIPNGGELFFFNSKLYLTFLFLHFRENVMVCYKLFL